MQNGYINMSEDNISLTPLEERKIISVEDFLSDEFFDEVQKNTYAVRRMFANYRAAAMEIETKFKVLDELFSLRYDHNPIETIKTRIKDVRSIISKAKRRNIPLKIPSIENEVRDIAGVRVVCSFVDDIYFLADCLTTQDDIILVEKKDYIKKPKPNGYRSLHLIVQVPIFTGNGKKLVYVEIQLRTIAMDFWASLEHKLRYKKAISENIASEVSEQLLECAEIAEGLDLKMSSIRKRIGSDEFEEINCGVSEETQIS